jgi:hypothetical protein
MTVLRGLLLDNLGLKLVALLLGLLVYLNVYTDRPNTMLITFPLEITDLGDSLSLSGPVPAVVQAELRGTGKQLLKLRLTEPPVRVSLVGVGVGRFQRMLTPQDLPLQPDEGPQVERLVGPRLLEIQVERRTRRRIPVAARIDGVPAVGFAWNGKVVLSPESLLVVGPRSALADLDSVRLRSLSIAGRHDDAQGQLEPESLPEWTTVDPEVVRVRVPVHRVVAP